MDENRKDNLTIDKLLSRDDLAKLCDLIMSEDIDNIIILSFRNKEDRNLYWQTTIKEWPTLLSQSRMVDDLIYNAWNDK